MTLMTASRQDPAEGEAEAEAEVEGKEEAEDKAPSPEEGLREAEVSAVYCLWRTFHPKVRLKIKDCVL